MTFANSLDMDQVDKMLHLILILTDLEKNQQATKIINKLPSMQNSSFTLFQIVAFVCVSVCSFYVVYKSNELVDSINDLKRNFETENKTNSNDNSKFAADEEASRRINIHNIRKYNVKIEKLTEEEMHNRISNLLPALTDETPCERRKFIVYRCREHETCNGWGGRQKGFISTYLMALLTKRYFIIIHNKACTLDTYLVPNRYNWTKCSDYVLNLPESQTETLHNATKPSFIYKIKKTNFDDFFQSQVVFILTRHEWNDAIMSHPKAAANIKWAVGKSRWEIDKIVLDDLFRPSAILKKGVDYYMENVVKPQKLICSHIRFGTNPSIPRDTVHRAGRPNITTIIQFLKAYDDPSKYIIYVASDADEIKQYIMEHFTSRFTVDMPIVHVDHVTYVKSNTCEGLYVVLLEQYLLSKCDLLLLTRSGYGVEAAYMSNKNQDLYLYDIRSQTVVNVTKDTIKPYYINLRGGFNM